MGRLILRRLLLAVPTLVGLTLLAFVLCAMAPGSVGAVDQSSGPGAAPGASGAAERALAERLGLGDPLFVQYGRWLRDLSPLKFGRRDQVDPTGGTVRPPASIAVPPLAGIWYWKDGVPREPAIAAPALPEPPEERDRLYRQKSDAAARARAAWMAARGELERTLARTSAARNTKGAIRADGSVVERVLRTARLDPADSDDAAALALAERSRPVFERAIAARAEVEADFAARPYPEAGLPIFPGIMSVGAPELGRTVVTGRPVSSVLASALPVTLLLNALACVVVFAIGIPAGMLGAGRAGGILDRAVSGGLLALWAVPTVWASVMALGYLAHRSGLGWFPVGGLHDPDSSAMTFLPSRDDAGAWSRGYVLDALFHACLPVLCLSYAGIAVVARQTRAAVADQLASEYVRTARAKGLSRGAVLRRHVMRNCLLPLITLFSSMLPAMLAGSIVVERVFSIPGMGNLVLQAVAERDRGLLLASVVLVGMICIAANVVADVLYAAADPRLNIE